MDILIRNAALQDLNAMAGLLEELFTIETDFVIDRERQKQGLKMMLDGCGKHRCVKVAEVDGMVVGMCSAQLLISTAEGGFSALLEDMVVTEALRSSGVGQALLEEMEQWSRAHGATRMQLLADRWNSKALDFYKTQGWMPTRMTSLRKSCNT